ncbi:MAG TPA: UDP-N-acetylglucosamine 2-epimerase (non-hydrolyzing) [Cyclobacteriaceae bacterium]|nr:UDP-N-acetylglucosamine 2-epimerase (non-hydrolyzing) [Cyclobacteriaceae bacterium]
MKLVTILGARPQFVKAATVSRELKKVGAHEVIVHTGQHFDHNMSQVFFDEMEIPQPDYNLEISGLNHGAMTGRMLENIEEVLIKEKPDYVLVYGDTNSTLAGALAAVKLHIPVAHVEAGLRSFEMKMPEEVNRILTDRISSVLFCPTTTAIKNLQQEGYDHFNCQVVLSGDVMYDAVRYYQSKIDTHATILQKENLKDIPFILVTLHRAENTNDPQRLKEICEALNEISKDVKIVLPLHPRTKAFLASHDIHLEASLIEPVGYFDMLALLQHCKMVMTDSGGLQKEAYFFEKFCITLRDQTEWVELVETGANALAGADKKVILNLFKQHYTKSIHLKEGLYGDGHAAALIANHFA